MAVTVPVDSAISISDLTANPYPIYKRLRKDAPVCRVDAVARIFLTKAEDTRHVKDNPQVFSSDDPNTPMKRAFLAHTLMRKDGKAHRTERVAIGGGINEPRDAILTILFGLLSNPEQLEAVRAKALWADAFEEGVRWIAPIQVSSRLVTEDTEIRGYTIC